jgi:hypothetical protein
MLRHFLIGSEVVRQTIVLIFKDFKVEEETKSLEKRPLCSLDSSDAVS